MIAFEYFDGSHKGVVQYDVPTGDYFARTYEAVSDDETGLISWAFCDSLGMHEDLFSAIAAIQDWFGVQTVPMGLNEEGRAIYERTRANGNGSRAVAALRMARAVLNGARYIRVETMAEKRAAVLAMAARMYATDMQRWPADLRQREARKTWANAYSFAREHANLI